MKGIFTTLFFAFIVSACSSSEPEEKHADYPNLTDLSPPESRQYDSSNVYIDSVKIIDYNNSKALLITGNMANGCTKLHKASHSIRNDSLQITLTGWQPSGKMCTQALVPFSFIYEGPTENEIENTATVTINQKEYEINL